MEYLVKQNTLYINKIKLSELNSCRISPNKIRHIHIFKLKIDTNVINLPMIDSLKIYYCKSELENFTFDNIRLNCYCPNYNTGQKILTDFFSPKLPYGCEFINTSKNELFEYKQMNDNIIVHWHLTTKNYLNHV